MSYQQFRMDKCTSTIVSW